MHKVMIGLVLASLLILGVVQHQYLDRTSQEMESLAHKAARAEEPAEAYRELNALKDEWESRKNIYHIFLTHEDLAPVEEGLALAALPYRESLGDAYTQEAARLAALFLRLREGEATRLENIL